MIFKPEELQTLKAEPLKTEAFRYIRSRYADEPLSTVGSLKHGGRYNVTQSFSALYLGFSEEVCQAEVSAGILSGGILKKGAFVAWKYHTDLKKLVRLDEEATLSRLGITKQDISIPGNHWTASVIGLPLFERGDVEGLVAPSAHLEDGNCLDIFLDRVRTPSSVKPVAQMGTWPV